MLSKRHRDKAVSINFQVGCYMTLAEYATTPYNVPERTIMVTLSAMSSMESMNLSMLFA